MEKGFNGLYNHVTPNVSDEALMTRLEQILEFVEEAVLTVAEVTEFQREVKHLVWEIKTREVGRVALEAELAWMEKTYEEDNG